MIKLNAIECFQKHNNFYLVKIDPRRIIELVKIPERETDQPDQRPWKESRVKEISKYCAGMINLSAGKKDRLAKGIIPNCPILNVIDPIKLVKEKEDFFILFPETQKEKEDCIGKIQILDGQHRLIAFSDSYIDQNFKNSEKYEMGIVVFKELTTEEKREIFMVANDKQEKVESNVLRQIKRWLGLLSEDEENMYDLVLRLNNESISPLQNRIVVGGNKVKNGIKLVQIIKILDKSKTFELIKELDREKQLKSISNYLKAWENVYTGMFNNPRHTLGKVSGLRYIFYLFSYISEIVKDMHKKMLVEDIVPVLENLYANILTTEFFNNEESKLVFRAETSTISQARIHGTNLKNICLEKEDVYNPFDI